MLDGKHPWNKRFNISFAAQPEVNVQNVTFPQKQTEEEAARW